MRLVSSWIWPVVFVAVILLGFVACDQPQDDRSRPSTDSEGLPGYLWDETAITSENSQDDQILTAGEAQILLPGGLLGDLIESIKVRLEQTGAPQVVMDSLANDWNQIGIPVKVTFTEQQNVIAKERLQAPYTARLTVPGAVDALVVIENGAPVIVRDFTIATGDGFGLADAVTVLLPLRSTDVVLVAVQATVSAEQRQAEAGTDPSDGSSTTTTTAAPPSTTATSLASASTLPETTSTLAETTSTLAETTSTLPETTSTLAETPRTTSSQIMTTSSSMLR